MPYSNLVLSAANILINRETAKEIEENNFFYVKRRAIIGVFFTVIIEEYSDSITMPRIKKLDIVGGVCLMSKFPGGQLKGPGASRIGASGLSS